MRWPVGADDGGTGGGGPGGPGTGGGGTGGGGTGGGIGAGAGPIALVGSGEYLPVLEFLERALLVGRPPRYVQLATAAAPEGSASLARWHSLGADAARRLGVEQVIVPVGDRDDADSPANADLVRGAGLIYLSGGNPRHLTESLRGTAVWEAIVDAWRDGAALAGCSAGAMALSAGFPGFRRPWRSSAGLGLVPVLRVIPHFDRFGGRLPDVVLRGLGSTAHGAPLIGIDEETALVGGLADEQNEQGWQSEPAGPGNTWQVLGRRSAWLLGSEGRTRIGSGESILLPVPAAA